jgi:ABC-type multidrug transport system fused ATPase/permease subunit
MLKRHLIRGKLPSIALSLAEDVKTILSYSAGLLKKYARDICVAALLKGIAFPLGLSMIYITRATLDDGMLAGKMGPFMKFSFLGLAVFLVIQAVQYFTDKTMRGVKTGFSTDINRDMTERMFGLDYLEIKSMSSSDNKFTMAYNQHVIEELAFDDIPSLVTFVKVPVLFTLSAMISPTLTLIVLAAFPFMAIHIFWFSKRVKRYKARQLFYARKHDSLLFDMLTNIKIIKSFLKENWASDKVARVYKGKAEKAMEYGLFMQRSAFINSLAVRINTLIFWILGGYLVISGRLSFGSFTAVSMYSALIIAEIHNAGSVFREVNEERTAITKSASFIRRILNRRERTASKEPAATPDLKEKIGVRDIFFGYDEGRPIFEGLSFIFSRGKWTIITGASGAGKTTLISLIIGLFPPKEGSVFIGEANTALAGRDLFSGNISVVHQEPYLFNDTLRNNILFGDEYALPRVEKAVGYAGLGELVTGLPLGYNSRVGESGYSLSGGERQRIAIARALVREPEILVLDEATSFLDPEMEKEVLTNIRKAFPRMTVIFVTHRESAKTFADDIFTLRSGRLIREAAEQTT